MPGTVFEVLNLCPKGLHPPLKSEPLGRLLEHELLPRYDLHSFVGSLTTLGRMCGRDLAEICVAQRKDFHTFLKPAPERL